MNSKFQNKPSTEVILTMKQIQNEVVFKKPIGVPRKRTKQKILDEDTYIEV